MSIAACAAQVERGDPDRFRTVMAAPVAARARLFPLYAFNLEVSRAPWITKEPMIAEMRLQWWRDVIDETDVGKPPRAHEVVSPLAQVMAETALEAAPLRALVEARRWDIYREPFADEAAFAAHLDMSAGSLMWAAAQALGAAPAHEATLRDIGWAAGLVAWFQAVPALEERGCYPLVDGRAEAVADLAGQGLARLHKARAAGRLPRAVVPAAWPAWRAEALLTQVVKEPGRVAAGAMADAEFARRAGLMRLALLGRW